MEQLNMRNNGSPFAQTKTIQVQGKAHVFNQDPNQQAPKAEEKLELNH